MGKQCCVRSKENAKKKIHIKLTEEVQNAAHVKPTLFIFSPVQAWVNKQDHFDTTVWKVFGPKLALPVWRRGQSRQVLRRIGSLWHFSRIAFRLAGNVTLRTGSSSIVQWLRFVLYTVMHEASLQCLVDEACIIAWSCLSLFHLTDLSVSELATPRWVF